MNITYEQIIDFVSDPEKRKIIEWLIKENTCDFGIAYKFFIGADLEKKEYSTDSHLIEKFSKIKCFNNFETKKECDKWARKINKDYFMIEG